jgi:hypothetical protein
MYNYTYYPLIQWRLSTTAKKRRKMSLKMKRLIADIPEDLHKELKTLAAVRNITIRKYVIRAIVEKIAHDTKHQKNESPIEGI